MLQIQFCFIWVEKLPNNTRWLSSRPDAIGMRINFFYKTLYWLPQQAPPSERLTRRYRPIIHQYLCGRSRKPVPLVLMISLLILHGYCCVRQSQPICEWNALLAVGDVAVVGHAGHLLSRGLLKAASLYAPWFCSFRLLCFIRTSPILANTSFWRQGQIGCPCRCGVLWSLYALKQFLVPAPAVSGAA